MPSAPRRPSRWRDVATHGSALIRIALISAIGIAASFAFQIVTARGLGPSSFGVLAAFSAIVNTAAIGSSSLQSSVAVQTARSLSIPTSARRRHLDGSMIEALLLGAVGAIVVTVASPLIAQGLRTSWYVPILAAFSIALSFLFARSVGVLQGAGRSSAAVAWSTTALVLRLVLVGVAILVGSELIGAMTAIMLGLVLAVIGAGVHAARTGARTDDRPFQPDAVVVIFITVAFAWLTSVDVIQVRAQADSAQAGSYAAAAALVKSGFLIPGTLSLYLLPRFVRQRDNVALSRLGARLTLAATSAGGLAMVAFFGLAGPPLVALLFGEQYRFPNGLLLALSLAYLPWIVAQAILIRITANASRSALLLLGLVVAAEWLVGSIILPDIFGFLAAFGGLGLVVLIAFLFTESRSHRATLVPEPDVNQPS